MDGLDVVFEGLQFRVTDFRHLAIVALTLGTFGFKFQVLHLLLVLLNLVDELALTLPLGTELRLLLTEFCNVLIQLGNLGLIPLALDGLALNLELGKATGDLVEFLRHGVTLHAEFGSSLVHQVDGLVGQETL